MAGKELGAVKDPGGSRAQQNPMLQRSIDKVLSVQRPVVLAHIRGIRRRRPDARPEEVIRILERRFLAAVTTGGAAVGASAVIPAVGVGTSIALTGVETIGFLEASALFSQSVAEVHGIPVEDPEKARALVMAMVLGTAGTDLVKQFAAQAAGGPGRNAFWGEVVAGSMPKAAFAQLSDLIQRHFIKRLAITQSSSAVGRAIPFGIGAVIGGTGNHLLGRSIVKSARSAFGPPPAAFPLELNPVIRAPKPPKAPKAPKQVRAPRAPKPPKAIKPKRDKGWTELEA